MGLNKLFTNYYLYPVSWSQRSEKHSFPTGCECSISTIAHKNKTTKHTILRLRPNNIMFPWLRIGQRWVRGGGGSQRDLAEDFVVGVKGEGGGEGSDVVDDERGVLERRRGGRQEGQRADFTVG